jgi:hypothetical protein
MATEILPSALVKHAAEIRRLNKQTMENIVEIGRRLSECRAIFKKNGEWCAWLKDELDWSDQTARRFIHVYEQLPELNKLLSRQFPISALYLLAAPSTPAKARAEIIERAQTGETVSVAEVKRRIETAKGRQQPAKRKPAIEQQIRDFKALRKKGEAINAAQARTDIGPDSAGVCERLRARNEELETENAYLRRKNKALENEIEDAKAAAKPAPENKSASRCSICREKKQSRAAARVFVCDFCAEIHELETAADPAPPTDDGFDIPGFLRRVAP